jgi:hypothetical protein
VSQPRRSTPRLRVVPAKVMMRSTNLANLTAAHI